MVPLRVLRPVDRAVRALGRRPRGAPAAARVPAPNAWPRQAWGAAIALAILAPASFLLLADNPAYRYLTSFDRPAGFGVGDALAMVALYVAGALPFLAGGLVGALLFRHRGAEAGRLYFGGPRAAPARAASLPIVALEAAGGPGALLVAGAFAALGAAAFARGAARRGRLATVARARGGARGGPPRSRPRPVPGVKFSRGRELTRASASRSGTRSRASPCATTASPIRSCSRSTPRRTP